MNLRTALAIFRELEAHRYTDGDAAGDEPIFDVRLDAGTARVDDTRTYRIRVGTGAIPEVTAETWQMVLDPAAKHDVTVTIQNNAIELT